MMSDTTVPFGQRLKAWREAKGVSAYRIAKLAGVHPSFLSNVEAGRRPMSPRLMAKIAAIPELQLTYEQLRAWQIQEDYAPAEVAQAYGGQQAPTQDSPPTQSAPIPTPLDGLYRIPLKMQVQAGALQPRQDWEEPVFVDWYGLKEVDTHLFCMQVRGASMWPPVPDGAILLVRETEHLQHGQKYVVETEDGRMTFKLIAFDKHGARLVPLNPDYPPIPLGDIQLKRLYQVLAFKVDWS